MPDRESNKYETLHGLPPLAGLCSMERAIQAGWSVEHSVTRLLRLHYVLKRLMEILVERITSEPIYELKMAYSYHAYLLSEQIQLIRARVAEMREPPLGLDKVPHPVLEQLMDQVRDCPAAIHLFAGGYDVVLRQAIEACRRIAAQAHPLADAPTVRIVRLIDFELSPLLDYADQAIDRLDQARTGRGTEEEECMTPLEQWKSYAWELWQAAGGLTGEGASQPPWPPPLWTSGPRQYDPVPQRDQRFRDPYNAGVNPEAFLYDPRYRARDKTLMLYYKRLRELDVPEMMASILADLKTEEPWEFYYSMLRQLWDEARHAMMGEVGFAAQGIDWTQIPINFTWSLNLNTQLTARERHGVLYFIEQGLMPRTGKRYEWEVATHSGDPLARLFQDFDWADEVLHAHIGRRWYVPRYASPQEALRYGDQCWSLVLSHWHEYRDQGLTEHRNWWPDLYRQACAIWGVEPDPTALAFDVSYENSRADLKNIRE
ncbi:MAG: hypothetical protein KatS3mg111_4157 [Pirellulaceae bacterium]|nr:MAG: hypothetical protein KatS3mg111_4157 [Pirellulaceae bacterium]